MSNRTWACIECGKSYRRSQAVQSVSCALCGQPCEYVHWKIRIPSPRNKKKWERFWLQYKAEKQLLADFYARGREGELHLEILNLDLGPTE